MINLAAATEAMLECAVWSSTDSDGNPLDGGTIAPLTVANLAYDLTRFVTANAADIEASGLDSAQVGHDFWLTRNGHGAGFWDRGLGRLGERLTEAAHPFEAVYLYVGDDGMIHG